MKRILLGTTMLIGAASFAAAAHADTPKVTLGGTADFQYGAATGQDLNEATTRGTAFRSDTEVTVRVDGKTDGGLGYGGGIDLDADTTEDADSQGTNASRTFLYVDGKWGRIQGGSDLGVTNTMKVDASRIARATGGIDGDFTYFINAGAVGAATTVIATPDLILDYGFDGDFSAGATLGDETTENANKISYYTPRFMGAQLGVSYIVDNDNKGQTVGNATQADGEAQNIITAAANWEGKFSNVGISLGATMERGNAQTAAYQDLRTWQAGGKLSYMGFSVAGSYGNWGDSLRTASNLDESHFYTLGAAYETGPFGMSVTWLDSTFANTATVDSEFSNLSIGADYKLAPGFTPYAEVSLVDMDPAGATTTNDNKAAVFIVGSVLSF